MKERTNITLWIYEHTVGLIDLNKIKSNWLKLIPVLIIFPFMFLFIIIALCLEEPVKCVFSVMFFQSTPKEAWCYYKKCWGSLLGGMKYK